MQTLNFTKAAIEALPVPPKGRVRYHDAKQPGLIVAVSAGGSRIFYVRKRSGGQLQEPRIGPFPEFTVDQARAEAVKMLAAIAREEDPQLAVGRPRGRDRTFGELSEWWIKNFMADRKHWKDRDAGAFTHHLSPALGNRQLRLITKAEVRELHVKIAKNVKAKGSGGDGTRTANKAMALARAAWNKALDHDFTKVPNPFLSVEMFPEQPRERRLTKTEAPSFFAALNQARPDMRDFILLLLFTGQRRGNVLAMRWDEIDEGEGTWTIPKTKNGRSQAVPLVEIELAILRARKASPAGDGEYVFPSRKGSKLGHMTEPKTGWASVLKRAGIKGLTLHDLRRSYGSWMLREGVALEVISKALGHSSTDVTERVYAHMDIDPVRAGKERGLGALTRVGGYLPAVRAAKEGEAEPEA